MWQCCLSAPMKTLWFVWSYLIIFLVTISLNSFEKSIRQLSYSKDTCPGSLINIYQTETDVKYISKIHGPSEWMRKSMIISKGQCLKLFRKFLFLQGLFPNFNQMLSLFIDWFWHESKCQSKANIFVFSIVFVYFNYLLIGLILKTNLVHFYHYYF